MAFCVASLASCSVSWFFIDGNNCISVSTLMVMGLCPVISTVMSRVVIFREGTLDKMCSRAAFSAKMHISSSCSGASSGSPISSKDYSPRAEVTFLKALVVRLGLGLVGVWFVSLSFVCEYVLLVWSVRLRVSLGVLFFPLNPL